jgi:hypothetical protein
VVQPLRVQTALCARRRAAEGAGVAAAGARGGALKHVHRLHPAWVLTVGIADTQGWYRVILWAVCRDCGLEGAFAAEQNTQHAAGRLLEPGR